MKRTNILSIGLLFLLAGPESLWAQQRAGEYYGPHMMWGNGMFFGPLMMLIFIVIIVMIILLLVRWLGGSRSTSTPSTEKNAIDILKERFARGEIDKEEYEERLKVLRD